MEIETLQIKRVTGSWNTHKTYKPSRGEYVLIDLEGTNPNPPKTLVLGTGVDGDTLETLITKNSCIIPFKYDVVVIDEKINALTPSGTPSDIDGRSSLGSGTKFAYSNHKHGLSKSTVESVLNTNGDILESFNCRKIKCGTLDPMKSTNAATIGGSVGDIYIRYENK